MRVLFDTSVLIASLVEAHPAHSVTYPWLQKVKQGQHIGLLSTHSLAELYSKLTRIPFTTGTLSAIEVGRIIESDISQTFQMISLSGAEYLAIIEHLTAQNLVGGIIFDALICYAGMKSNADQILTLNARHFHQIYPNLTSIIMEPSSEIDE